MRIKEKMILDGENESKLNARIVVDGLLQKHLHPETIGATFAGTSNFNYLKALISAMQADALFHNRISEYQVNSSDIDAAFLQTKNIRHNDSKIYPTTYAQIPLNVPHERAGEFVRIDCGWYGTGDGNRLFWIDLGNLILQITGPDGAKSDRCPLDSSLYKWTNKKDQFQKLFLSCHVDDLSKLSTWPIMEDFLDNAMKTRYGPLKHYRPMKNYLGLEFDWHLNGSFTIHKTTHLTNVVKDFGIPISTIPVVQEPAALDVLKKDITSPPFNQKTIQAGSKWKTSISSCSNQKRCITVSSTFLQQ
jgi:hypothetical protein